MKRAFFVKAAVLAAAAVVSFQAMAQDKVVRKIIEIGQADNRVMEHEDFLANRIGGRPVGSDALLYAESWVAKQLRSWGYEVKVQEAGTIPVAFNRGPWSGRMLSEDGMMLHFCTPAYTAGTKGPQIGHVVIEPKTREEFEKMKGTIKGAWVLIGGKSIGFALDWSSKGDETRAQILARNDSIAAVNREIGRWNYEHRDEPKEYSKMIEEPALLYREMVEAGALGFIQSADVPLQCHYDRLNAYNITMDNLPTVCDIKLDADQYDVIFKKASRRERFFLEFDIRNHFREGPVPYSNVIAVLKGSKYPDEYVMTGGHLDAFDCGTGAVDDGQGTSVNLETARLLAMAGARPKRSIMICVWTAEEYGLYGSQCFVESKTVPLDKISNYFNRDGGPECATSVTVTPAMYDDFVKACEPIMNLNPDFPFSVVKNEAPARPRPTRAGGSDHAYFAMNGVPTVSFGLTDPKGYNFQYREIWHTERDNYDKVIPEYLEHSSVVQAVVMYNLANLDHLLSREGLYSE